MTDIFKGQFTVTLRLFTIISMWGSSLLICWKMSAIYSDVTARLGRYDRAVVMSDSIANVAGSLVAWKAKVDAYYTKPENTTVSQTTTKSKTQSSSN